MKIYTITFQGYWRHCAIDRIPSQSGRYLVYRGVYHVFIDKVVLNEIIYIGQAKYANERIKNHDRYTDFVNTLSLNEELCYAFAPVDEAELDTVEGALIFVQKPKLNKVGKDSYNHDEAKLIIGGDCIGLRHTNFHIYP